jgi:hypothetical protein
VFICVAAWIVDLREPFAKVDAAAEALRAAVGQGSVLGDGWRECQCQQDGRGHDGTRSQEGDVSSVRDDW